MSWTCPKCGRTLTVRNQEHTCGHYDLEGHFERRDPIGRVAFDWMVSLFESFGSCDVLSMKTMIAFASGVNFAFIGTKRTGVEISFVLTRPLAHARVVGEVPYSRTKTIYRVLVCEPSELDGELAAWLREAYENR